MNDEVIDKSKEMDPVHGSRREFMKSTLGKVLVGAVVVSGLSRTAQAVVCHTNGCEHQNSGGDHTDSGGIHTNQTTHYNYGCDCHYNVLNENYYDSYVPHKNIVNWHVDIPPGPHSDEMVPHTNDYHHTNHSLTHTNNTSHNNSPDHNNSFSHTDHCIDPEAHEDSGVHTNSAGHNNYTTHSDSCY